MSNDKNNRNLFVGTAVVAGILGTLSAIARSGGKDKGWKEQAQNAANRFIERDHVVNKNMLLGGVAAGLIGAAAALLLAPKAGSDLIHDLLHPLGNSKEDSESGSHKKTHSKQKKNKVDLRKKQAQNSLKEPKTIKKRVPRAGKIKLKSSPVEKKLTRRKRTKASVHSPATLHAESSIGHEAEGL